MSAVSDLVKIVSGGQSGADIAGLRAGTILGLETGGWAPKGWKTEHGPKKELLESFGLKECFWPGYSPRTSMNVTDSDGTVLFGKTDSVGSFKTQQCCEEQKQPLLLLRWFSGNRPQDGWEVRSLELRKELLLLWLEHNSIKTLNVAGNRESVNPGIEQTVIEFLVDALS